MRESVLWANIWKVYIALTKDVWRKETREKEKQLRPKNVELKQKTDKRKYFPDLCFAEYIFLLLLTHQTPADRWSLASSVRTSKYSFKLLQTEQTLQTNYRYSCNCGSGREDHWWHTCLEYIFVFLWCPHTAAAAISEDGLTWAWHITGCVQNNMTLAKILYYC